MICGVKGDDGPAGSERAYWILCWERQKESNTN